LTEGVGEAPPPFTTRVDEETAAAALLACVKSPKSAALPFVAVVK